MISPCYADILLWELVKFHGFFVSGPQSLCYMEIWHHKNLTDYGTVCVSCHCRVLLQKSDGSGKYIGEGDRVPQRPKLANTLRRIMENGFDEFYNGMTATSLVNDLNSVCAARPSFCRSLPNVITAQDLTQYEVKARAPFKFSYDSASGYDVYTAPAPYGGPALAVFLGIVTSEYMQSI